MPRRFYDRSMTFAVFYFLTLFVWSDLLPAQGRTAERANTPDNSDTNLPVETPEPGVQIFGKEVLFPGVAHYDLSPDGQYFVGFRGLRMMVWNRPENRLLKEVDVIPLGSINRIKFSPAGKYLAVLLQRWEPVAEQRNEIDGDNPLAAELVEAFFKDRPPTRNLLLIYNRRWELVWEFDVDLKLERLHPFDPLKFAPDESSLLLQGEGQSRGDGQTLVFDLEQGDVLKRHPTVGPAVYLSANQIAWPQQRLAWSWRRDREEPLPEDMLADVAYVQAQSPDGDWLMVIGNRVTAAVHHPTGRQINIATRNIYATSFSPDGRYAILFVHEHPKRHMMLLDLEQGKETVRVEAPPSSRAWFIPDENEVLIDVVRYDVQTWSATTTFHSIPMGEGFETAIQSVRKAIPPTERITFANRDQAIVLANSLASIDLTNGSLTIRDFDPREVQHMAADPQSHRIYTFGSSMQQVYDGSNEVQQRSLSSDEQKRVMQISPPPPVVAGFGRLFGVKSNTAWITLPVHLSVSGDGARVRELHDETKRQADQLDVILDQRFVYSQYDVVSGQRLPETRLEFPKVDSKSKLHFGLSPDGQLFGFAQGTFLSIGETTSGELQQEIRLPGLASQVTFSRDNRWVAVGLESPSWQVSALGPITYGRALADQVAVIERASGTVRLHKRQLEVVAFGFHPVKSQLYIVERKGDTGDKTVTFYDEETWAVAFQHRSSHGKPLAAALSHGGTLIAFPLSDSRVEVWNFSKLETNENRND